MGRTYRQTEQAQQPGRAQAPAQGGQDAQDQYGNAFVAEQLRAGRGLRDRSLRQRFAVPGDYDAFRTEVEAWLAGQVMSRTPVEQDDGTTAPARREHDLVEASNLRDLFGRLAGQDAVTLEARLVAGAHRYERVEFATPGLVLLDPIEIEVEVPDRPTIVRIISERLAERRRLRDVARQRIVRANELCQSVVMDGSTRYRPDEVTRRYLAFMQTMEIVDAILLMHGRDDTTAIADYNMRRFAIREGERRAEEALAAADAAVEDVERLDADLDALYDKIGETYVPSGTPRVPPLRR